MAKRIIQMYDKYHSTTKVYPKIIKESLEKDVTDYIEGQVEANPSLAGTEASLTGLQVGDTKYKVEQPINVVANPTLAGTEGDLEGLQVGDTKYKIGGSGGTIYRHCISLTTSQTSNCPHVTIVIDTKDPNVIFSKETLYSWLTTNGFTAAGNIYYPLVFGNIELVGSNYATIKDGIAAGFTENTFSIPALKGSDGSQVNVYTSGTHTINDKVLEI